MTTFTGTGKKVPWGQAITQNTSFGNNNPIQNINRNSNTNPTFGTLNNNPSSNMNQNIGFGNNNPPINQNPSFGNINPFANRNQNSNTNPTFGTLGNNNPMNQNPIFGNNNPSANMNQNIGFGTKNPPRNQNPSFGNINPSANINQNSNNNPKFGTVGNNNAMNQNPIFGNNNPSANINQNSNNTPTFGTLVDNNPMNQNTKFGNNNLSANINQNTFGIFGNNNPPINRNQTFGNNNPSANMNQNSLFNNNPTFGNNNPSANMNQNALFNNNPTFGTLGNNNNPMNPPINQNQIFRNNYPTNTSINQNRAFTTSSINPNPTFGKNNLIVNRNSNPTMNQSPTINNNPNQTLQTNTTTFESQNNPQLYQIPTNNQPCSESANKIIKEQMLNALTREDWETLLLLSNSVKSWGNDAPPELSKMANEATRVANAKGFTTELVYANLIEFSTNGPVDVKLLKAKLTSKKREERKEDNEEIDQMTKNAKTILQKLQESKTNEEDIAEFKEKFYLDENGQEQINEIKKSSRTILHKAVRLQTTNEVKMVQDLTREINENKTDPWTIVGLSKSLYQKLLSIYGTIDNFVEKYVRSNFFTIFLSTIILKFATVFICNVVKTGFAGINLSTIGAGIGFSYSLAFIAAVIPLALIYYMTTAAYGFVSQQSQAYSIAGAGLFAFGTGQMLLFWMKRFIITISSIGMLYNLCSLAKDLLLLIVDVTINKIPSLTISGMSLCTSTYNEFIKSVLLPKTGKFFQYLMYTLCKIVGTITKMNFNGMILVDFCELYSGMVSGIMEVFNPMSSVEDIGDPAKIVASQSAWETLASSLNIMWTNNWFGFTDFPEFVTYWTSWFPNRNTFGEYSIARFLLNMNGAYVLSPSIKDTLLGIVSPSSALVVK